MNTPQSAYEAADIVMDRFRRNGIDPGGAVQNLMAVGMAQAWVRGEYTDADFDHACGKLLILNPSLAIKQTEAAQ